MLTAVLLYLSVLVFAGVRRSRRVQTGDDLPPATARRHPESVAG